MTVIIGLVDKGTTYLACDSYIGFAATRIHTQASMMKVLNFGKLLFGCSGEMSLMQKLGRTFKVPVLADGKSDYDYLNEDVIPAIFAAFKDFGAEYKDDKLHILIAYGSVVCRLFSDGSFIPAIFESVGCGCEYAKGALSALYAVQPEMPSKEKIKIALQAAVDNSNACYPPFHLIEVPR